MKRLAILLLFTIAVGACAYYNTATAFCSANGRVNDAVVAGDDVYVAGEFTLLRNPDGTTFARNGVGSCSLTSGDVTAFDAGLNSGAVVNAIALSDDDDTAFLGGNFTHSAPSRTNAIAVRTASNIIRGWEPAPTVTEVHDIIRVGSGANEQVYLGGQFDVRLYQGTDQTGSGNQITSFAVTVIGSVKAMALSDDASSLYLGGGNITDVNGVSRNGAAAVDGATGATLAFAPDLADPNDNSVRIFDIVQHEGFVYYCGDWWQTEGIGLADKTGVPEEEQDQRNVNRFDPVSGVADKTWWPFTNGGIQACAIDASADVLLIGGHFQYVNGEQRDDVATLRLGGGAPLEAPALQLWDPDTATIHGVYAMTVASDGTAIVGGDDQLGVDKFGDPAQFIARFAPTG